MQVFLRMLAFYGWLPTQTPANKGDTIANIQGTPLHAQALE